MTESSWVSPDGRTWTFRPRPEVRKSELGTHVVVLIESLGETRIVSCFREEWDRAAPDWEGLLARSVPVGGSRGMGSATPPTGQQF